MNGSMIDDITKLRESFIKYQQLCNDEKSIKSEKWISLLDKTDWPYHLLCAIDTANTILNSLLVLIV